MTAASRVLVVGYNALDVTVTVGGALPRDGKREVPPIRLGGGGPGATAAVALARLGVPVRLLTVLTDDEGGRLQRRELAAAGVGLDGSPIVEGESARAVILVDPDDGARTILWSRGPLPALPVPEDPAAILGDAPLLYVDGHETAAAVAFAGLARERGLPVVMDAGSVRPGTRELVACCTDVVAAAAFLPAFTGSQDLGEGLRRLAASGPERVAVTLGAGGVLGLEGGRLVGVPAFAVAAADTTGAGDAFHAGYAAARLWSLDFPAALRFAAAVAALKCRDAGGRAGLPDRAGTEAFLAEAPTAPPDPRIVPHLAARGA